jgi:glycosyltransferase involved in cell wall biosynthesis
LKWLEAEGPFVPRLLNELGRREDDFSFLLFFSYRYFHSFHGIHRFSHKAILVPTAEHDETIYIRIFKELFQLPAAIIYNSHEERELIQKVSNNAHVLGDVVGVGSEIPQRTYPADVRKKYFLNDRYLVYVGRLDENKGVPELLTFFARLQEEGGTELSLVLAGKSQIPLPDLPKIRYLGFVSEKEKFDLLAGSEFLVIPSQFESLSMVALEAWAMGKPVLANGRTEVLRGQCRRSRAGLWYRDYEEFREVVGLLENDASLCSSLGQNGKLFFSRNYSWPEIERKYLQIFSALGMQESL